MRKFIYGLLLFSLLLSIGSCSETPIIFEDELPQFEIKSDAILLEVIMPKGSTNDDEYYIAGEFNGGDEAAMGNSEWLLEKATNSDSKWGIYLYPSSFKNGKTLADGFHFVAKNKGEERSVKNEPVTHRLNVAIGSRTNVWVDRWASYFDEPEEGGGHKGFVIYVDDKSEWDNLYLYGWDSNGDVMAPWPGIPVTGTENVNGIAYKYFDLGEELNNREGVNLIFNNNDGTQFDGPAVTFNRDYYFRITGSSYEEIDPKAQEESYTIYIDDQSGWDALAIYGWGDNGDVTPAWPGVTMDGTKDIDGTSYKVFPMPLSASNSSMNLIFNNNNGGIQFDGPNILLDRDYYFRITSDACEEVTTTN